VALLRTLGFQPASNEQVEAFGAEADELVMVRPAAAGVEPLDGSRCPKG
jgi:hypothetical protein